MTIEAATDSASVRTIARRREGRRRAACGFEFSAMLTEGSSAAAISLV
jgi:hypothetical protein